MIDILRRCLVSNVVGDALAVDRLLSNVPSSINCCALPDELVVIDVQKTLGHIARKSRNEVSALGVFMSEINRHFENGMRIMVVSGFPLTVQDAREVVRHCPHHLTFSLDERHGPSHHAREVLKVLKAHPTSKHHSIQSWKGQSTQMAYFCNRIQGRILDYKIEANLAKAARQVAA